MKNQTLSKPETVEQLDAEAGCPAPLCSRLVPYYDHAGVTIYHGDARVIVPQLGRFDLLLTDPPYGINLAKMQMGNQKDHRGADWDGEAPDLTFLADCAEKRIVWGGNYFPFEPSGSWLVWDKKTAGVTSFADAEMAWTNLGGATRMFRWLWSGPYMEQKEIRYHPTQKPEPLLRWCIERAGDVQTILDPFAGSGTTGRAAKDLGKRAVLIEREEKYCEIAANRMSQEVLPLYCENASVEARQ